MNTARIEYFHSFVDIFCRVALPMKFERLLRDGDPIRVEIRTYGSEGGLHLHQDLIERDSVRWDTYDMHIVTLITAPHRDAEISSNARALFALIATHGRVTVKTSVKHETTCGAFTWPHATCGCFSGAEVALCRKREKEIKRERERVPHSYNISSGCSSIKQRPVHNETTCSFSDTQRMDIDRIVLLTPGLGSRSEQASSSLTADSNSLCTSVKYPVLALARRFLRWRRSSVS